jgi:uncharacterized protein YwgA
LRRKLKKQNDGAAAEIKGQQTSINQEAYSFQEYQSQSKIALQNDSDDSTLEIDTTLHSKADAKQRRRLMALERLVNPSKANEKITHERKEDML